MSGLKAASVLLALAATSVGGCSKQEREVEDPKGNQISASTTLDITQDPLASVVESHIHSVQTEQHELYEHGKSLMLKIDDLFKSRSSEYSQKHSQLSTALTSGKLVSADFFTKTWAGLKLAHLVANGEPTHVHLSLLDPDYGSGNRNSKCIKALELLEEAGLVTIYRDNRGILYEGGPVVFVPCAVNLTEQGKAYVASLKKES